ncbi:MAG: adenylate/guanylate cyclase domain-containing protein [Cyclobacteriaceae bacterium]|nr:adenylate/guanylate cyclase domain-containing protein [Cyclobacteriaceae bacterium]
MEQKTQYAKSGKVHIAYQVVGSTDRPDLVLVPGWVSNIEAFWDYPSMARFLNRLSGFSRLILFDKRGTGLSDRVNDAELPTLEERMDDVRAVMDAAGSDRAALFGYSEGGPMSILFAATYQARTTSLICYGTYAKRQWAADYPWAPTEEKRNAWLKMLETEWGSVTDLSSMAPSVADDPGFRAWWSSFLRRSISPSAVLALGRMNTLIDVRDVLPAVRVPTLIIHRSGDQDAQLAEGKYIAERIPGAQFIQLDGDDHLPWIGDIDSILNPIQLLITGNPPAPSMDRVLMTVLLVDIVDSTSHAARLGDHQWLSLLEIFHTAARKEIERLRGNFIKSTGDGVLATFDGPARATWCACALRDAARGLKIELRAGLHTGEIQLIQSDVGGIAVHVASRVMAEAGPGEVWTTSTVRDLVSGSGIIFRELGTYSLKGTSREWQLYRVEPG